MRTHIRTWRLLTIFRLCHFPAAAEYFCNKMFYENVAYSMA
jgi:hypothetical protein